MLDFLTRLLGLDVKKRIEESPGEMVIDLRKITLSDGVLRIPIRFDFPEE